MINKLESPRPAHSRVNYCLYIVSPISLFIKYLVSYRQVSIATLHLTTGMQHICKPVNTSCGTFSLAPNNKVECLTRVFLLYTLVILTRIDHSNCMAPCTYQCRHNTTLHIDVIINQLYLVATSSAWHSRYKINLLLLGQLVTNLHYNFDFALLIPNIP